MSMPYWKCTSRPVSRGIAALIACLFSSSLAAQPTLRKIVDSTDPVPGGFGATWESFLPFFEVVVDGDELAFIGFVESSSPREGVYLHRGGSLEVVADTESLRPGTGGPLGSFLRVALDDGVVAFTNDDPEHAGAYRFDSSGLRVVADHRTPIPGREPTRFGSFGEIAVHDGSVLFAGGKDPQFFLWHQEGLYLSAGGMLARLVDSSTPLPGGAGGFGLVGDLDLDAAGFAFTAPRPDSSVDDGIYRNLGDGIEVVADLSTIAPHSGTPFEDFRSFSYGSGAVAFTGVAGGETAVYLHDGTLRTIASQKTLYPGTGHTFDGFANRVATSEGRVAFWGFRSPPGQLSREGLFVADGPDILTIVEAGRKLDGRVVSDFTLSSGAFDWPYLAFTVVFEDGGSALYRMNFAGDEDPEPPAGPWLTSPDLPGFRVQARISAGGSTVAGLGVAACIEETLCVSGALPDRAELFVRVVGPKPNGKLWPTLIKFSTSRIEVWIEQTATGVVRYYDLPAVAPGAQRLDLGGMADKLGFDP